MRVVSRSHLYLQLCLIYTIPPNMIVNVLTKRNQIASIYLEYLLHFSPYRKEKKCLTSAERCTVHLHVFKRFYYHYVMNQLLYCLYFEFLIGIGNQDSLLSKVFISTMLFKANYRAISSTFHKIWTYMLFMLLCHLTHLFLVLN